MLTKYEPEYFKRFLCMNPENGCGMTLDEALKGVLIFGMPGSDEDTTEEKKPAEKPKQAQKKQVDRGRVMALYNGNWKVKDIAEDCGCSEATVYTILKQLTKEGKITRKEATDGGDA
jgi:hypothetical protein